MHIRGVILEGYSHAGKTSLLKEIKRCQMEEDNSERSVVILGEHYTQVLNSVNGECKSLTQREHLELLKERVSMLKQLNDWAIKLGPASRRSRGIFFVLERFHLNHRAAFVNSGQSEISKIEEELTRLGAKCVLLTISDDIETRIKSRNPEEWDNKTHKETEEYIAELIRTQDSYRQQSKLSKIPTIEINTDSKKWEDITKQILKSTY